jgi:hypothetical protein
MNRFNRFMMRAPIALYRVGLGGLLGKRFLLLEHTGRKSGLTRRTALEIAFTLGRKRVPATARRLDHPEAVAVFDRYRINHPKAAQVIGKRLGVSLIDDIETAAAELPLFRLDPTGA